jgi:hypothetical protein
MHLLLKSFTLNLTTNLIYYKTHQKKGFGMRSKTGHIIFPKNMKYKDLVPVYRDLYMRFLKETGQVEEEEERNHMLVRLNLLDLEKNRKPEGHNRNCRTKMVFPIRKGKIEFYIKGNTRSSEITQVTESISKFLNDNDIDHEVEWDKLRYLVSR